MTWPAVAQRAVDAGFRTFGVAATYTPAGAAAAAVTIVMKAPAGDLSGFNIGARRPARVADVRASEVPAPVEGDVLMVGAESFKVRGATPDTERLVWTLDMDPA